MTLPALDHLRRLGALAALVVLAGCLALLLLDQLQWQGASTADRDALCEAEAAARQDSAAAERLNALVEQQTTASLNRNNRVRWVSVHALLAASVFVWLLSGGGPEKPRLPGTLAAGMPLRVVRVDSADAEATTATEATGEKSLDLTPVGAIIEREGSQPHQLIPLLHAMQSEYRYLPREALAELCRLTDISPAQVVGVASFYTRFRTKPCGEHLVQVCRGAACHVAGADRIVEELRRALGIEPGSDTDPRSQATVETVGCMGCCHLAPAVKLDEQVLANVRVEDLPEVVDLCQSKAKKRRGAYQPFKKAVAVHTQESSAAELLASDSPDSAIVTEGWDRIKHATLDEYERQGGFAALAKCLARMTHEEVIDEVEASGLRGRGGGGFPTARKWRAVCQQPGKKHVIANGDEGDPGAFMDRSIMESAPASVLEGMLIAARAVGASRGVVYVRNEYPLAVRRIRDTVAQMRGKGYLGEKVLGSDFSFDIEVVEGAGAFVCGEETALIESVMGRRGTPRSRPPYPAESGLWGRPTLVNNVETLANLPWIIRQGGSKFAARGTAASKGTKVFSLAGKIQRGGLVEAPMGTTIRQLVDRYGGGVAPGRRFKAVQIGGPSGGCLPEELADTPIDYEALRGLGAIMGSGGLVVLDDTDCMVDVARYFLEFTQKESCGHCTFCRVGTLKLLELLEKLCAGKASRGDLDQIESLAVSVTQGSLCGLGKTAPNPVLTTLKYFRDEYEAHLEGRCPAGRCKDLISYHVTRDCVGCTLCAQHCPVAAIEPTPYRQHVIDADLCTRCDACRTTCPEGAIVTASPAGAVPPHTQPQVA